MVDPRLDDEDRVRFQELVRGRVDGVENDALRRPDHVVEPDEDHRLALLGRHLLDRRDDPPDGDDLAVPPALELRQRRIGLAPQLVALVKEYPGEAPVVVALETSAGPKTLQLGKDYRVQPVPDFFAEAKALLGEAAVV